MGLSSLESYSMKERFCARELYTAKMTSERIINSPPTNGSLLLTSTSATMSLSRTKNYTPFDVSWFNDPILPTISRNQSSRFGLITPRCDRFRFPYVITHDPLNRMNVKEHDNTVTATFDLPGMKREDVTMDLHNGYLTVSSGGSTSNTRKEAGYVVRERASGGFSRSLRLPNGTEVRTAGTPTGIRLLILVESLRISKPP